MLLLRFFVLSQFEIGKIREMAIAVYNKLRKKPLPAGTI
jgi:hypothetical protein